VLIHGSCSAAKHGETEVWTLIFSSQIKSREFVQFSFWIQKFAPFFSEKYLTRVTKICIYILTALNMLDENLNFKQNFFDIHREFFEA
jgi:hypothetical protein